MTNASNLLRTLLIYAVVLPLGLILGYFLATPYDSSTMQIVGVVIMVLCIPLWLKWHTPLLWLSWNMTAVVFFLPGRPQLWLVMGFASLIIALVERTVMRDMRFIYAPSIVLPTLFLVAVVFMTAKLTGGFGVQVLGSGTYGGKAYIWLFGAAAGLFAMLARPIPPHKRMLYMGLFFLGALTNAVGNTVNLVNPALYYIFLVFPVDMLPGQETHSIARYGGLSVALLSVFYYMLARYGIREMIGGKKFWRFFLFTSAFLLTLGGGYRAYFILMSLTFLLVFYLEGLFRSKYGTLLMAGVLVCGVLLVPLADKLPMPVQRSISFLPIKVDPIASKEAELSTEWRVNIWKTVLPDVPKYFWLGKGYSLSGTDLQVINETEGHGPSFEGEGAILVGNYHNGPLSVLLSFGIWGAIGWLWFLIASLRVLYFNRRYGDDSLRTINTLLLAYFAAKTIFFFTIFGDFRLDFALFAGLIGLSLSLNGGIRKPVPVPRVTKPIRLRTHPALRAVTAFSQSGATE